MLQSLKIIIIREIKTLGNELQQIDTWPSDVDNMAAWIARHVHLRFKLIYRYGNAINTNDWMSYLLIIWICETYMRRYDK